ncbi:MAG: hypothetical protein ABI759_19190 [Candidatus Solibacter sp.]
MKRLALWLALLPAALAAGLPASWVPARWDGGPVELARRAGDKAVSDPAIRDAISGWYDPATLNLLDGSPINCLLVTLTAGADPQTEKRQLQLVKDYALRAHERSLAVLGLVYPGADPERVVLAVADAQLDGVVLEGEFPQGLSFAHGLEQRLRAGNSAALVIPIAPARLLRETAWPATAVEGVSPGTGKAGENAVASATSGIWIDSNIWLVRSLRAGPDRPVWISHRPRAGSPGIYSRSLADAAAAGARWIVSLDDDLRARLLRRDAGALADWRSIMSDLAWFEAKAEARDFMPYGKVGIVIDTAAGAADDDEFLNLVARRQIPYRVIYRRDLDAAALAGLRALLAFGCEPPAVPERKLLSAFAAHGGLVLSGPAWGGAPKQQSYTVLAEGEGEVAVYKERSPDPEAVARDLNDLVPTPELGVSVFNAPSVLSYVSAAADGRISIRLANYATAPAQGVLIWVPGPLGAPGDPGAAARGTPCEAQRRTHGAYASHAPSVRRSPPAIAAIRRG